MLISKCTVTLFVLCLASGVFCKPTKSNQAEGRGIGSTLWDWISYPFSWWGSEELPTNQQLVGSTTRGPYDNIEIARRNVTVWCNDHTCTTMKCDKHGCTNITCNIYDTYLNGECRVYNTLPEETPSPPTQDTEGPPSEVETEASTESAEEHPLELEAVMSSTVQEKPKVPAEKEPAPASDKKIAVAAPQNKV